MLESVHTIHEERIIHGKILFPRNFFLIFLNRAFFKEIGFFFLFFREFFLLKNVTSGIFEEVLREYREIIIDIG